MWVNQQVNDATTDTILHTALVGYWLVGAICLPVLAQEHYDQFQLLCNCELRLRDDLWCIDCFSFLCNRTCYCASTPPNRHHGLPCSAMLAWSWRHVLRMNHWNQYVITTMKKNSLRSLHCLKIHMWIILSALHLKFTKFSVTMIVITITRICACSIREMKSLWLCTTFPWQCMVCAAIKKNQQG